MTVEEFESLLEIGKENPNLEFKASCKWNISLIKDILAMANIKDGGYIIIGIKENNDGTYEREGIKEEHKSTYKEQQIKDQVAEYADPYVDFEVYFLKDKEHKEYVVIKVHEFKEIPVICKKDYRELKKGIVYYRSTSGRPKSAPVSNSYEMREIIERSAVKIIRRWKEIGISLYVEDKDRALFEKEIEDIL